MCALFSLFTSTWYFCVLQSQSDCSDTFQFICKKRATTIKYFSRKCDCLISDNFFNMFISISEHRGYKSRAEAWIVLTRLPRWRSARLFSVSERGAALESPKRQAAPCTRSQLAALDDGKRKGTQTWLSYRDERKRKRKRRTEEQPRREWGEKRVSHRVLFLSAQRDASGTKGRTEGFASWSQVAIITAVAMGLPFRRFFFHFPDEISGLSRSISVEREREREREKWRVLSLSLFAEARSCGTHMLKKLVETGK